jgi:hypothetical protein
LGNNTEWFAKGLLAVRERLYDVDGVTRRDKLDTTDDRTRKHSEAGIKVEQTHFERR